MNTQTIKKAGASLSRLATVSGRKPMQAALILAVLVTLVPVQLMAVNSVPLVNQPLVPAAAAPGGAAFALTVSGTGFASTAVVKWNGAALTTTFVSSSKLTAAVPVTAIATAGTAAVTVTNPAPGGGTSNPVAFAVVKPSTGTFMARTDISVNSSAQAVVAGDFRGIGKQDLAIANAGNSVDVRLGNGDGTFQTAVNYAFVSGFPVAIIAADVNGDGKQDLVVVLGHTHQIAMLLGNGDGSFTMGQEFDTGLSPDAVVAADVNNDGKLDLVTTNFSDSTVSVLLGNGDGTFQAQRTYSTGIKPVAVAVGDFNGDGLLDLAVANNTDNTVSILLGAGNGTFPTHVDYPTAGAPTWVVAGDFNGDGKLDLGVSTASGRVSVLLGKGDGTVGTHQDFKIGRNSQYAVAVDTNGDGHLDLATVDTADNAVSLLLGVGDGTFKSRAIFPTNAGPAWLTVGDYNRDGKADFAVVDSTAGKVSLLAQTALSVSPTVLQFPTTEGGFASAPLTVTLRNNGTTTIGIANNPPITGANAAEYGYTTTCGTTIAGGSTCTFTVTFTPQDLGTRYAQIVIPETNGSSVGISLIGNAVIRVSITPDPHTFPTTLLGSQSAPFNATFTNLSKLTVSLNPPAPGFVLTGLDTNAYQITGTTCPTNLTMPPLIKCTVSVVFKPTQVGGETAALTVFGHFSPGNGQQAILMSGIGTEVSVSPKVLSYGAHTVGTTSLVKTVTVKNTGTSPLPVTVSLQGTNPQDFHINNQNCTPNIAAGGSCTVGVTFTPLATGAFSATLNIGDPDPTGPQIVTLSGSGQ
ncbi:MAG TPA: FG-GAP-like repeat-containing protein [Candidatus Sulfotelmatobacter sp.]|nr:FG-GAP-like repeat-containing protein [Candidatus Sulfotelmatobacter sp.]